jgi:soluble cytochrome b562
MKPPELYQDFFNFLNQKHNLICTVEEMDEIIREAQAFVKKFNEANGTTKALPTKEEALLEADEQISTWLYGNTKREKQCYRVGFRRGFQYVIRQLK